MIGKDTKCPGTQRYRRAVEGAAKVEPLKESIIRAGNFTFHSTKRFEAFQQKWIK